MKLNIIKRPPKSKSIKKVIGKPINNNTKNFLKGFFSIKSYIVEKHNNYSFVAFLLISLIFKSIFFIVI